MHCRCCDSMDARRIDYYEEWYCDECLEVIEDTLNEYEDLEDTVDGLY